MSNFYAFLMGAWTLAWVMVAREGALPFVGHVAYGVIYVTGVLAWVATFKEERNGE